MPTELRVPVFANGERRGDELLPVEPLGGGRFRVLASPGMAEGLAAGDELALAADEALGYRVLRRGGNVCVWFYFETPVDERDERTRDLGRAIEAIGGWLDGGYSRMIVLTVPARAGFPAIEATLNAAAERHPGSQWLYGNVYDPRDGVTPLEWWR